MTNLPLCMLYPYRSATRPYMARRIASTIKCKQSSQSHTFNPVTRLVGLWGFLLWFVLTGKEQWAIGAANAMLQCFGFPWRRPVLFC